MRSGFKQGQWLRWVTAGTLATFLLFGGVDAQAAAKKAKPAPAAAATKRPNILIIWGDDVGFWNISAYNQGMMGCVYIHHTDAAREWAYDREIFPSTP